MGALRCDICGNAGCESIHIEQRGTYASKCPFCGVYRIDDSTLVEKYKTIIAGYLFEIGNAKIIGTDVDYYMLHKENIEKILASALTPRSISEKLNKLLDYVDKHTTFFGEQIITPIQAAYLTGRTEMENLLNALFSQGLINDPCLSDINTEYWISLSMNGINYVEEHKSEIKENQCFVAMWFNKETNDLWEKAIKPGCLEAGYTPVRIDKHPHNNNIIDEILAGIRKSLFLIADFTGQNRGVYYEAGFAKGLGKDVIQLCRNDHFEKKINPDTNKPVSEVFMHFDNVQVNTISWEAGKEEEVKDKLRFRIESVFGLGRLSND